MDSAKSALLTVAGTILAALAVFGFADRPTVALPLYVVAAALFLYAAILQLRKR